MKPEFMVWWQDKGIAEYRELCQSFGVVPTEDTERVCKFTAWQAYSEGLTAGLKIITEKAA